MVVGSVANAGLSAEQKAILLVRVLLFDRALSGDFIDIAVVFAPGEAASREEKAAISTALRAIDLQTSTSRMRLRIHPVALDPLDDAEAQLTQVRAKVAYLCSGLVPKSVQAVRRATTKLEVLSITGTESYLDAGVSVALTTKGDRARVIVNLRASREERAELQSEMLNIAEVR